MTALAAVLGVGAGMVALAVPAAANVPVGGWCYYDSYDVQSVTGVAQQRAIPTRSFQNSSGSTVNWTQSYTDSTTYSSTYSTTTSFQAGVDLGIIKVSVNSATTVTTTETITVTTTSSFTVAVPPYTTAYADYGPYGEQTSGVYDQTRYACDESLSDRYPTTTTSGALSAFSLTSVGWHYWDSNGGSGNL